MPVANTKTSTAPAKKAAAKGKTSDVITGEVLAGEDLPLLVIRGKARPKARVQLGEGGKVYTVTKPKDMYLSVLQEDVVGLSALLDGSDTSAAAVRRAKTTLQDFVTCAFDPADQDEVMAYLLDNGNNEEVQDVADAMRQLMARWAPQASPAAGA